MSDVSGIVNQQQLGNQVLTAILQSLKGGILLSPGQGFFNLAGYWRGQLPADAAPIQRLEMTRTVTLQAGLPGSNAICLIAPASPVSMTLRVNGSGVGLMQFAAGATTGTFAFLADVAIAAGAVWEVLPPSPQDAQFSGLSWNITGLT